MNEFFFKVLACMLISLSTNVFLCCAQSDKELLKSGYGYFESTQYQKALKEFSLISTDYKKAHIEVAYYEVYSLIKLTALHKADSILKGYNEIIVTPKNQKPFSEIVSFLTTGLQQYRGYLQQSDNANVTKSYKESLQLLNKAIAIDSFYIDAYVKKAFVNLCLENYADCINDCNKIQAIQKNNAAAYYYQGSIYYKQENYREAEKSYTKSLLFEPLVSAYYQRACTYYYLNEYKKSLQDVNAIIQLDNQYVIAFDLRGLLNKKLQKYKEALKDYEMVIAFGQETAEAYLSKGECLYRLDKDSLALTSIDKSLSMQSDNSYAYYLKACCLVSWGDYFNDQTHINALNYFNLAIKYDSTISDYYYERGVSKKMCNRRAEAIIDFSKAITLNNLDYYSYYERNTCHELIGSFYRIRKRDLYEGINSYKGDIIKKENANNTSYFDMAKCYKLIWDFTKDRAYLDTTFQILNDFIKNNPANALAYYERGMLSYFSISDYDKAIEDFQIALKYDSTHYLTYTNLGWAYMHSGKPEQAYDIFILMKKRYPKSYDVIGPYITEARRRIKSTKN